MLERFLDRAREVLNASNGVAALATILSYIYEVTETPPERVQQLVQRLGQRGEEANMTAADILRQEGKAEGKVEGRADVLAKSCS